MGSISDLVMALSLLGSMRAWDTREEDRKSRQEEAFVPFRLPPLTLREQSISHPAAETKPCIAVTTSALHAQSTP
jgi:hypothetical protein